MQTVQQPPQPSSDIFGAAPSAPDSEPAADAPALIRTARGFFILATAIGAVAAPFLYRQDSHYNFLVIIAAVAGLLGLGLSPSIAERVERHGAGSIAADTMLERWSALGVFAAFLALYGATMFPPTPYNEQLRQAVAFIHGHVWIDAPQSFLEHAQIGPYSYALHAPLPAILMMPLAAIWGMKTDQTEFSVVIGAIDIALAWVLIGRLGRGINVRVWLTLFFGTGTVIWYETLLGTTWAMPMICAVLFTLLALIELFGDARPLWIGTFAAMACLARYDMVLAVPSYAAIAYWRGRRCEELLWIVPPFAIAGAPFVGFNEVRYHSFFDQGMAIIAPRYGHPRAFSLAYLPGNLYTLFFMAPGLNDRFPYIHPEFGGQALTLTSPAFVLALRPSFKRLEVAALGIACALVAVPSLLFFANGYAQFGTRLYITIFPLMLAMMALGMGRRADQLVRILIVASTVLVSFGIWHIRMYGFG